MYRQGCTYLVRRYTCLTKSDMCIVSCFKTCLCVSGRRITQQENVYIVSVYNNREFTLDLVALVKFGADRTVHEPFHDASLDDWTTKLPTMCTDRAAVKVGLYNGIFNGNRLQ